MVALVERLVAAWEALMSDRLLFVNDDMWEDEMQQEEAVERRGGLLQDVTRSTERLRMTTATKPEGSTGEACGGVKVCGC